MLETMNAKQIEVLKEALNALNFLNRIWDGRCLKLHCKNKNEAIKLYEAITGQTKDKL